MPLPKNFWQSASNIEKLDLALVKVGAAVGVEFRSEKVGVGFRPEKVGAEFRAEKVGIELNAGVGAGRGPIALAYETPGLLRALSRILAGPSTR